MAKITIPAVSGGFNLKTDVNTRLQQIEDELNNKVLYRDNPVGEANSLSNDIDMNNNDILNAKDVYLLDSFGQATSFNETIDNIRELLAKNTSWNNRGVWTTATTYNVNDIWSYGALWYIVTTAYTSGVDAPTDISGANVSLLTSSIGTEQDQIELNSQKTFKSFDSLTAAIAFVTANPNTIERLSTSSYRSQAECTTLGIAYPDGGGADYVVVAGGTGVDDGGSFINAGDKQLKLVIRGEVSLRQFGALVDGSTDDSTQINNALAAVDYVVVPSGAVAVCKNLLAPDNKTLEVRGILKLPNGATDQDAIVKDSVVTGFTLKGSGTLDGNRANQAGVISTEAVRITTANKVTIKGLEITSFYGHESAAVVANCVHISGGKSNKVSDIRLTDWSQEGILMSDVQYSIVSNIEAIDNAGTSWSAVQVSGATDKYNIIDNVTTFNTGATAVGMDSQYSAMSNITVDTVRYFNGINLGHAGKVASYSTATNITVRNLLDNMNATSAGISVVNGTEHVTISNFIVDQSTQRGVNISSSGQNVQLMNGKVIGAVEAISVFAGGNVDIVNFECLSCTNGISKDAGTAMKLVNVNLTGATNQVVGSAANITAVNTDLDTAVLREGGISVDGLGAGGTVVVNNINLLPSSRVVIEPSNDAGANTLAYIQSYAVGSFTVATPISGGGGAFLKYKIF